jgi:hypothetical protein
MKIVDKKAKISKKELVEMSQRMFGNLVKAVVDVEKGIMAVDAELHADEEACLLEKGSEQKNLWGINLYPEVKKEDFVEFDSMINLRPSQGNRSRNVEDKNLQEKIMEIVNDLVSQ